MIALAIDMIVLKTAGNAFFLRCLCGNEFAYIKDVFNSINQTAQCDKCKATWTGKVSPGEEVEQYKTHFYLLTGTFRDEKMKEQHKDTDGTIPILIGTGIDMQHFALCMIGKVDLDDFDRISILEISEEMYNKACEAIKRQSMQGVFNTLINTFFGNPEEGT